MRLFATAVGACILCASAEVQAPAAPPCSIEIIRGVRRVAHNDALELAAQYFNALGPDRTLTPWQVAQALRALKRGDGE